MSSVRSPKATNATALLGGVITGGFALGAGWLDERFVETEVVGTLLTWAFLIVGFLLPMAVLVVGREYYRVGLWSKTLHEASGNVAGVWLRLLLWFGAASGVLLVRGLHPLISR